jgi:hypothetical protein
MTTTDDQKAALDLMMAMLLRRWGYVLRNPLRVDANARIEIRVDGRTMLMLSGASLGGPVAADHDPQVRPKPDSVLLALVATRMSS